MQCTKFWNWSFLFYIRKCKQTFQRFEWLKLNLFWVPLWLIHLNNPELLIKRQPAAPAAFTSWKITTKNGTALLAGWISMVNSWKCFGAFIEYRRISHEDDFPLIFIWSHARFIFDVFTIIWRCHNNHWHVYSKLLFQCMNAVPVGPRVRELVFITMREEFLGIRSRILGTVGNMPATVLQKVWKRRF